MSEPVVRSVMSKVGDVRYGVYEPGNSTKYEVIAVAFNQKTSFGELGTIEKGWLVTESHGGRSYLFTGGDPLFLVYVKEKLGLREGDARYFTKLIGAVIGVDVDAT